MNCQRCSSTRGGQAVARVRGEILNLKVCAPCAKEAADWGLHVEPLEPQPRGESMRIQAAA